MNDNFENQNNFNTPDSEDEFENISSNSEPQISSETEPDYSKAFSQPEPEEDNGFNSNSGEEQAKPTFEQPTFTNPNNYSGGYGNTNYQSPQYNYSAPQQENRNSYGSAPQQENRNPYSYQPQQQYSPYGYNGEPQKPKKSGEKGKKIVIAILSVAVIIAFAAILASFLDSDRNIFTPQSTSNSEQNVSGNESAPIIDYSPTNGASLKQLSGVQIADKCRPAVVGVMTYSGGQLDGEGSGVVMGKDSTGKYTYIITCAHVISGKGVTYGILTLDEKRYEATLVAYDTRTDIGVLRVEASDLVAAEFGDSSSLKVGETVYAIGNPGGAEYFGSMTDGIISSIDRSIASTYTMTCIQHSAAINPGNSGGALVNSAGQVIGINSSKIAATGYEGMGFAIPMSTVKPIVENLIKNGYVPNRPKLGIQYASVSSYQLYNMVVAIKGLPSGSLVIAGISADSSLANTKAQVGDLIIAVNGKNMDDSSVLLDLIDKGAVGDTLTLTLCRVENRTYKTSTFDVTITLIEDKGTAEEKEETTTDIDGYYYGGANSFEDFFKNYFGFGW